MREIAPGRWARAQPGAQCAARRCQVQPGAATSAIIFISAISPIANNDAEASRASVVQKPRALRSRSNLSNAAAVLFSGIPPPLCTSTKATTKAAAKPAPNSHAASRSASCEATSITLLARALKITNNAAPWPSNRVSESLNSLPFACLGGLAHAAWTLRQRIGEPVAHYMILKRRQMFGKDRPSGQRLNRPAKAAPRLQSRFLQARARAGPKRWCGPLLRIRWDA